MAETSRKRCREVDDVQSEGGRRRRKHMQDQENHDDPAFEGRWDSLDEFMFSISIYKWLQGVETTPQIPYPKKTANEGKRRKQNMDFRNEIGQERDGEAITPTHGAQENIVRERVELEGEITSYSMEAVAEALPARPGSPQKRRLSLGLNSEPSRSSSGQILFNRKFAAASSRWTSAKSITRTSSPEKSVDGQTRSSNPKKSTSKPKSRSASPEKRVRGSVASIDKGQGRGRQLWPTEGQKWRHAYRPLSSGTRIAVLQRQYLQMSLASTVAGTEYPVEYFAPSLFATESPYHENLLEHVKHQCVLGNRNFNRDTDEGGWSSHVHKLLEGIPGGGVEYDKPLVVSRIENRQLLKSVTSIGAPGLRSDLLIEGNPDYPSEFANTCERSLFPPSEVDKTLSPTAHRTSQFSPAFCVIEVKAEGGDFQEAQTQAAVVGALILLKARQIGASPDVVPCVPAIVTIGHIWHLNLIYEEKKGIVIAGPWIIGNTLTFLGTLRVVLYTLFVEELRRYAIDTRWPNFVDGSCRELLERRLEG
ncbi:hypothetical protein TWF191_008737 [Orbilia oligospora]|uniref:PD-(D/E)XK nuclease-like domain-containing protein n=1 Tax=Orbilia oligospora TaxID=2813651 RepID=A0A7C8R2Z6_ORBOL|nr:hypothetical protein TWF191_008737 [Orbilia oligospora]